MEKLVKIKNNIKSYSYDTTFKVSNLINLTHKIMGITFANNFAQIFHLLAGALAELIQMTENLLHLLVLNWF